MKISVAQINPIMGDLFGNTEKILSALEEGKAQGAQLVLFPESAITGYPVDDFLLLSEFIQKTEEALQTIIPHTQGICAVIGLPTKHQTINEKPLYNSAAIIIDRKLIGYQHKILLPEYDVFNERRYFEPGTELQTWDIFGERVAITICEDIWEGCEEVKESKYAKNILDELQKQKPDLFLNLSASPYHLNKVNTRINLCKKAAFTLNCPVVLCNQVGGNDSLIFDGHSIAMDCHGELQHLGLGFKEDQFLFDTKTESQPIHYIFDSNSELNNALVLGLKDYCRKSNISKACLGLSGGIDSALVACIAVEALGSENVLGVLMPSRYSSQGSLDDAYALAKKLKLKTKEIGIESTFAAYLDLLTPHFENAPANITEENLQARIRGMILMALSNKFGSIVLATGNKSEIAMGYCTLYGDLCGGLAIISDLTKTQVYQLAEWINRNGEIIPQNTIHKPPSAELRPDQKDSDTLPDYQVLDQILQAYIVNYLSEDQIVKKFGFSEELVNEVIRKIHQNEFKRRQAPPGLRVSTKAFTTGRKFPIVQHYT